MVTWYKSLDDIQKKRENLVVKLSNLGDKDKLINKIRIP